MTTLQSRISKMINRFDICKLLKLLYEIGYHKDEIHFESNPDFSSRPSLCEAIIFSEATPQVRIIVNLGLLSANSPLPNFFRKKMDAGSIDPILFTRYLSFFDHHLIRNLLSMSMPESNELFFSNWQATKGHYLKLLDLSSTSTLWYLFQVCFPELIVKVVKQPRLIKQNSSSTTLGTSRLGVNAFLGKKVVHAIPSYKCTLIGEETHTDLQVPWPIEIKNRLKGLIFSLLQRTHIHFRVVYILRKKQQFARLLPQTQLGYCMLGEGKENLKLLLFSGHSKDLRACSKSL